VGHAGNVVFAEWTTVPAEAAPRLEDIARERFSVNTRALLVIHEAISHGIEVAHQSFPDLRVATCLLYALAAAVSDETLATVTDRGARVARAGELVVHWCPDGVSRALAIGPLLERAGAEAATGRNLTTMSKILLAAQ
jgi:hypothetical protein